MKLYKDETGAIIKATNYRNAAEKLYNQQYYHNPACRPELETAKIPTVYTERHNGYATVKVFNVGDKQGSYWGVQRAFPIKHILKIYKNIQGGMLKCLTVQHAARTQKVVLV
jgi:hypothetical protein